ncbi:DUF4183 domain-containing protein, partial [Priestia megaterium]|uniref:DUF4183 domain-containing protein n=1 Tax=Priestia megaterium TaxID=1404 RepID=UPI0037098C2F
MLPPPLTSIPPPTFIHHLPPTITPFPHLTPNSYPNIYINPLIQPTNLYTLSTTALNIHHTLTLPPPLIL